MHTMSLCCIETFYSSNKIMKLEHYALNSFFYFPKWCNNQIQLSESRVKSMFFLYFLYSQNMKAVLSSQSISNRKSLSNEKPTQCSWPYTLFGSPVFQNCVTISPLDQTNTPDLPTLRAPTQKKPCVSLAVNSHKGAWLITGHSF